jgi:hypothetical protein
LNGFHDLSSSKVTHLEIHLEGIIFSGSDGRYSIQTLRKSRDPTDELERVEVKGLNHTGSFFEWLVNWLPRTTEVTFDPKESSRAFVLKSIKTGRSRLPKLRKMRIRYAKADRPDGFDQFYSDQWNLGALCRELEDIGVAVELKQVLWHEDMIDTSIDDKDW